MNNQQQLDKIKLHLADALKLLLDAEKYLRAIEEELNNDQ